ncbi:MAG: cyclic nucleotide-binding domain-containing protein [Betaproteobacteria bacterium]|nr:cyclic nucleotide-binding domain-containing protein [Betaproteobacteria bacterium]
MSQVAEKLVGGIPLFVGIERAELEGFMRLFQPVSFDTGARIRRQGRPADSAFMIESGNAEVVTALPGGGEAMVASLGPGSLLGEMALLESGKCSATVIARTPVAGYVIERDGFRMLLAQRDRAAFLIQQRITRALCQRLRELNARIVSSDTPESAAPPLAGQTADPAGIVRGRCSFGYRAFLPALPVFGRFTPGEIEDFTGRTEVMEIERSRILFQQGDPCAAAYVIVRGALEILHAANGQRQRIGILGPGRLCGILALIEGHPHSMSAAARERTVLLELPKAVFDALFTGRDPAAARFQDAINRELLQALARTNNHLTRLISQACIRSGRKEKKQAEELGRALGEQDCRAA